jgi:hypothetical protein
MSTHPIDRESERAAPADRRESERLGIVSLECDHGVVLDLSESGLRLLTRRRLNAPLTLTLALRDDTGATFEIEARVVWTRRVRFAQHLNGLEFSNMSQEAALDLMKRASVARKAA